MPSLGDSDTLTPFSFLTEADQLQARRALQIIRENWHPSSRCYKWFRKRNVEISFNEAKKVADALCTLHELFNTQ